SNVDGPAKHLLIDAELGGRLAHALHKFRSGKFRLVPLLALRVERRAQEGHRGNAGNFQRILEGQKQPLGRSLVRTQFEQVNAIEQYLSGGDLVSRFARQNVRKRRLARTVRSHDGVDFALVYSQVEAVENVAASDIDVQILDFKHCHCG